MNDNLRSVLLVRAETPRIAAEWNNNLQSFTEGLKLGKIASEEYRALGITTALSPQIDLATEPRWSRFYGTLASHRDSMLIWLGLI